MHFKSLGKIFAKVCSDFAACIKMASQKHAFVYLSKDNGGANAVRAEFEKVTTTQTFLNHEAMSDERDDRT